MTAISYRDITAGLKDLGLNRDTPVLAHIRLNGLGAVKGGLNTVMGALLATVDNVMMPAFTFSTLIIPEEGPANNLLDYGSGRDVNLAANVFSRNLKSEQPDNETAEALRVMDLVYRSEHPVFSFTGLGLDSVLAIHPADNPYAPIEGLLRLNGWVLLMGAAANQNFSIHYAEKLANRKQLTRWAMAPDGVKMIPYYPMCSNGFHKANFYLQEELHTVHVGSADWQAVRLDVLIRVASMLIQDDPFALLCNDLACPRCNMVRAEVKAQIAGNWQPENPIK
jgi:aminoglycoside 3-N-acetyltransferase